MVRKFCVQIEMINPSQTHFLPKSEVSKSFGFWDVSHTVKTMHQVSPCLQIMMTSAKNNSNRIPRITKRENFHA